MDRPPRPPIVLEHVLDDPALVPRLVARHAPYWPVQRYFANAAEYGALSGATAAVEMPIAPVFRGNWADERPLVDGVEPLFDHAGFRDAAAALFGGTVVRPHLLYVNVTWQLPFPQGVGHTDIPAFRGFDRRDHPITLLSIMGHSGLFEDVRVPIATAVAWFYEGTDGGFEYWPDGPDAPSRVHEGAIGNTAIVGDNDFMWHRVRPVGRLDDGMPSLTRDSELTRRDDGWAIVDGPRTVATPAATALRTSVSWKAYVFADAADARRYHEHREDITPDRVMDRFARDLDARGIAVRLPTEPERDPDFIRLLAETYVRQPA